MRTSPEKAPHQSGSSQLQLQLQLHNGDLHFHDEWIVDSSSSPSRFSSSETSSVFHSCFYNSKQNTVNALCFLEGIEIRQFDVKNLNK